MRARYDPINARFLSRDPILAGQQTTQELNGSLFTRAELKTIRATFGQGANGRIPNGPS